MQHIYKMETIILEAENECLKQKKDVVNSYV